MHFKRLTIWEMSMCQTTLTSGSLLQIIYHTLTLWMIAIDTYVSV